MHVIIHPDSPSNHPSPVMCHQSALGVAQGWDELHNVLSQLTEGIIQLVRWSFCLSIASHVNSHHSIVLAKLPYLVSPRKPELYREKGKQKINKRQSRFMGAYNLLFRPPNLGLGRCSLLRRPLKRRRPATTCTRIKIHSKFEHKNTRCKITS